MSELAADLARVTAAIQKVLRGLSDEDVAALLAGEGTLRFVPKGHAASPARPTEARPAKARLTEARPVEDRPVGARAAGARRSAPAAAGPPVSAADVRAGLAGLSTEDGAIAYLTGLGLTVAALRTLAAELGLRPTRSQPARDLMADLVRVFVSGRVTTRAVRSY